VQEAGASASDCQPGFAPKPDEGVSSATVSACLRGATSPSRQGSEALMRSSVREVRCYGRLVLAFRAVSQVQCASLCPKDGPRTGPGQSSVDGR
jgi:hypothetical protein